jgi:MFS family permease
VGPFAGGLLTQHFGWRSIFILVVPMGAASIGVTLKFLTGEWADARGERLDVVGSLLYAISILMLVYGATQIPAPSAPLLMLGGVAGLAGFVWQEVRVTHPVFEVSLFRHNRLFAFSSMAALINYAATFAVTFLISLYLQYAKGMSPQNAGILLVAQPAVMALFSPLSGRISDRTEPARLASAGMGVCALGLLLFAFAGTDSNLWRIAANLALLGFGFALFSSPNMSAIMGSVPKRFYGIASGAVATMRLLGQLLSMAVATVTFAVVIGKQPISTANLPLFLTSMRICFGIFTILCVCGMFFSLRRGALRN